MPPASSISEEVIGRIWNLYHLHRGSVRGLIRTIGREIDAGNTEVARGIRNYALATFPRHPGLISLGRRLPVEYSPAFYAVASAGAKRSARHILGMVRDRHPFRSVVDFGAGAGEWLTEARCLGADRLLGVDGRWARESCREAGFQYRFADLNRPVNIPIKFDLAVCVEVAEHLLPSRGPNLVAALCRSAPVVVFGAALPRQFGDGHINCRSQSYWIRLFARQGFHCHDYFRPCIWKNREVEPWYRQNTFLFTRMGTQGRFGDVAPPILLDVYHPSVVIVPIDEYVKLDHEHPPMARQPRPWPKRWARVASQAHESPSSGS